MKRLSILFSIGKEIIDNLFISMINLTVWKNKNKTFDEKFYNEFKFKVSSIPIVDDNIFAIKIRKIDKQYDTNSKVEEIFLSKIGEISFDEYKEEIERASKQTAQQSQEDSIIFSLNEDSEKKEKPLPTNVQKALSGKEILLPVFTSEFPVQTKKREIPEENLSTRIAL